ncbi:hypothetical protein [Microbacterium kribbense]|uniref:hypothetical protein n=1 Tax=Microbacterium kribbense TaxID=433645 RepID=UPI0031D34D64
MTALKAGEIVHSGGSIWSSSGIVVSRGQVIVLTRNMIDASKGRNGKPSGLALAGDTEAQLSKWGEIRWMLGRPDEDFLMTTPGTPEHAEAREAARRAAWMEPNPGRRAAALNDVQARYGTATSTSHTLNSAPDPSVRLAAEQDARLAKKGN